MPKFKCPYTYPARSRKAMADYVANNCGAYYSRDGNYPVNYNVKAHYIDLGFPHLFEKYAAEHFPSEVREKGGAILDAYRELAKDEHERLGENTLWEWGQEDAWRSLNDGDAYRMLWSGDKTYTVEFLLLGRSGGHLCIRSALGINLEMRQEDLLEKLMDPEQVRIEDLRVLYRLARQWEIDFTPKKASEEIEYQAAFQFFVNVCEQAWEHDKKERAERNAVVAAAKDVLAAIEEIPFPEMHRVREQYKLVTRAAGVLDADLAG